MERTLARLGITRLPAIALPVQEGPLLHVVGVTNYERSVLALPDLPHEQMESFERFSLQEPSAAWRRALAEVARRSGTRSFLLPSLAPASRERHGHTRSRQMAELSESWAAAEHGSSSRLAGWQVRAMVVDVNGAIERAGACMAYAPGLFPQTPPHELRGLDLPGEIRFAREHPLHWWPEAVPGPLPSWEAMLQYLLAFVLSRPDWQLTANDGRPR
jgi:hypothetical protein